MSRRFLTVPLALLVIAFLPPAAGAQPGQIPSQLRITPKETTIKSYFYNNRLIKESELLEVRWAYTSNYQYKWEWQCTGCPHPVDFYVDVVSPFPRVTTNQVPQPTPAPVPMNTPYRPQVQVLAKCSTQGRKIQFTAHLIEPNGSTRQTESAYVTVDGYACPPGGPPEPPPEPPEGGGAAYIQETASVFTHRRCTNCHQSGSGPKVGDSGVAHPLDRGRQVARGDGTCNLCHSPTNPPLSSAANAPKPPMGSSWDMPPSSMAFAGRSISDICKQISDPMKNGNRTLAQILDHVRNDHLIDWSFNPVNHDNTRRTPAGNKSQFVSMMTRWVNAGGGCPP